MRDDVDHDEKDADDDDCEDNYQRSNLCIANAV